MKAKSQVVLLTIAVGILFGCGHVTNYKHEPFPFEQDVAFLKNHTDVIVLQSGDRPVAVVPQYQGRKFVDEMGSPNLKIIWDLGNGLYANEKPFPDAYEALRGGALGHYHIKDAIVDMPKARVEFCELGTGQSASSYEPTAKAFKEDGYEGVISLESVYCPVGGTFDDGSRASVGLFKRVFS